MNINKLIKALDITVLSHLVPFIQGSPGIGKSDVVREIANKYKLKVIDIRLSQCDPTDLSGLPKLDGNKATYLPFDTFPLEGDPIPEGYQGWLIFMDEINSAPKSLQAVAYKLILDRMVGQYKLHHNVVIMCAGNKETDNAVVNPISTALRSRLITLPLEPDVDDWLSWANLNNIDWRIQSYIRYAQLNGLYDFNPDEVDNAYACPRSWAMLDKILKHIKLEEQHQYEELIKGTIGMQVYQFNEFCSYCSKLPNFEDVLNGTAKFSSSLNIGERYLISGFIMNNANKITNDVQASNVIKYLDELGKEFTIPFYAISVKQNPKLIALPSIKTKMREYAVWLTN